MIENYNTIVIGLGAFGSASLYQLAKRGDNVLGIDQFAPPHSLGSSSGETRITRQAIGEGAHYTPLALRSYEIFRDLERQTNQELLLVTGGLMLSSSGSGGVHQVEDFYGNMLQAAKQFDIRHDLLEAADIRRRFPQFTVQDFERAYFEYESGVLYADRCIEVQLGLAEQLGAQIHKNEKVLSVAPQGDGVRVVSDRGEYYGQQVVLSAGPWLVDLIGPELAKLFEVHRQVLFWFDVKNCYDSFVPGKFPVFIWELPGARQSMYGFPALNGPAGGFKIGSAEYNEVVSAEGLNRQISLAEIDTIFERQVKPFFPQSVGPCCKSHVCLYTNTPDSAFLIDRLPGEPAIIICSPCSGHGFKHSAAIGESIAQLVLDGKAALDLSPFELGRLIS